jgi:membrane protease YdiL (CAAX protease family)
MKNNVLDYSRNLASGIQNLENISIAGFIVIAQLFLLLSSPHLFEESVQDMFLMYFLMLAFSYAVLDRESPFFKISVFDGLSQLGISILAGVLVFSLSGYASFGGFESLTLLILSQALVIGIVEEMLFRGAIPNTLDEGNVNPYASRLIAIVSFSLFHVFSYDFEPLPLVGAFLFGILMQFIWDGGTIEKGTGYPLLACGLHAAWNIVVITSAGGL